MKTECFHYYNSNKSSNNSIKAGMVVNWIYFYFWGLFNYWYIKVSYGVGNTVVKIMGINEKTKLWSMYLSFLEQNIHQFLYKKFVFSRIPSSAAVPFFIFACPIKYINAFSRSSDLSPFNHFRVLMVLFSNLFFTLKTSPTQH